MDDMNARRERLDSSILESDNADLKEQLAKAQELRKNWQEEAHHAGNAHDVERTLREFSELYKNEYKAERDEARNEARKYYRLYLEAREQNAIDRDYILQYQEEIKVHRKRAIEVIAKCNDELKETQEQINNWKDEAHYAGMAHKKVQKKLKTMGLKWHNDKVDRNKKLKEAQERILKLRYINDWLRQRLEKI